MEIFGKALDAPSTMAYFTNVLEKLDPELHMPLYDTTWQRDIQLLEGISFGMEATSFIRSKIAAIGSQGYAGIPWYNGQADIPGVSVDGEKVNTFLRLAAQQISYDAFELARSQMLNQPIDRQKFDALNILYQMGLDEMVYIGSDVTGSGKSYGLLNNPNVAYDLVTTGVSGYTWALKTPAEIVKDINDILSAGLIASGMALVPSDIIINPANFALIASKPMSDLSLQTVLQYVTTNNLYTAQTGKPLTIKFTKWATGRGQSSYNRMVAYTNRKDLLRFPLVPIRAEQSYYRGISFIRPYVWMLGEVELVKPETIIYRDEI